MSLHIIGTLNPKASGLDFGPEGEPNKCLYMGYRYEDGPTWFGVVIMEPPKQTRDGKWLWKFVSGLRNLFPPGKLDDEVIAVDYEEWTRLILSEQYHWWPARDKKIAELNDRRRRIRHWYGLPQRTSSSTRPWAEKYDCRCMVPIV